MFFFSCCKTHKCLVTLMHWTTTVSQRKVKNLKNLANQAGRFENQFLYSVFFNSFVHVSFRFYSHPHSLWWAASTNATLWIHIVQQQIGPHSSSRQKWSLQPQIEMFFVRLSPGYLYMRSGSTEKNVAVSPWL